MSPLMNQHDVVICLDLSGNSRSLLVMQYRSEWNRTLAFVKHFVKGGYNMQNSVSVFIYMYINVYTCLCSVCHLLF